MNDEDLMCGLCHLERDTLEHRILGCTERSAERNKHPAACRAIKAYFKTNPLLCTRGIMPHPADNAKLPLAEGGMRIQRFDGVGDDGGPPAGLGGRWCFWDGTASRHPVIELQRVAWAFAYLDEQGRAQAVVTGPSWQHLPQTPQASEHVGAVAAIQTMSRPTTLVGDCLGVFNCVNHLRVGNLPRGAYAGSVKDLKGALNLDNVRECRWTPSHTALKPNPTEEEAIVHDGNDVVDKAAAAARLELEDDLGRDLLKGAEEDRKMSTGILRALGEVLALLPAIPRGLERQHEARQARLSFRHDWTYSHSLGHWRRRARGCFNHNSFYAGPPKSSGPCRPGRALLREERARDLGHDLAVCSRAGTPITYCRKCAAHGSWRRDKLLELCRLRPSGKQAKSWLCKALTGAKLPLQPSKQQAARAGKTTRPQISRNKPPGPTPRARAVTADPLRNKLWTELEDRRLREPWLRPLPAAKNKTWKAQEEVEEVADDASPRLKDTTGSDVGPTTAMAAPDSHDGAGDEPQDEMQCEHCLSTILATDLGCSTCGRARPKATPMVTETVLELELVRPHREEKANAVDLPWHGGALTPPPGQLNHAADVVEVPGAASGSTEPKPKRLSGYMAWVRLNRTAIAEVAGKAGGLKAFGVEAGKRWKSLSQDERDAYKAHSRQAAEDDQPREGPHLPPGVRSGRSTLDNADAEDFLMKEPLRERNASPVCALRETPEDTIGPQAPAEDPQTLAQRRMASMLARARAKEQERKGAWGSAHLARAPCVVNSSLLLFGLTLQ